MKLRILYSVCFLMLLSVLPACRSKKDNVSATRGVVRKKMLVAAEITAIKILSFPRYGKDGESWDAYAPFATDADPFVKILWNETLLYQSETLDNQPWGTLLTFERSMPLKLVPFDQPLIVEVFDEDGISGNDNMGYVTFKPIDAHGKPTVTLQQGELALELSMQWYYE